MEIFVIFKTYRQANGEYVAVETEAAFPTKEQTEAFLKGKPNEWWERKLVPLATGEKVDIDFLGIRSVHPTEYYA